MVYPEMPMTDRTNLAARTIRTDYIGWVADDNRFETKGWDRQVFEALERVPIAFGNDVVSPGSKPSHVFMHTLIPKALKWLILPGLRSTFFDDVWAILGVGPSDVSGPLFSADARMARTNVVAGLGLTYLGEVRIPHLYTEKDNSADFMADMQVYGTWLRHKAEDDIAVARRALRSGRRLDRREAVA